ncbi:DNA polymerase III subunit chi [Paraneptunicella aestuarii]|uniref:DNA polymerase III subunit chi n=1 Tax=Paraneptunicella aestuarii TaxID=2831148 RepID=UPI001E60434F|nr:DNA polymerase III subunit chi [Paraneptunicella aestuarii]UAA38601.1 DNA polymerase III subunit chi [Paraneptunicella aestuarii]
MPAAIFYLLPEETSQADSEQQRLLAYACDVAARCYRNRQRVWVQCQDQQQAEAFDELLWQRPVDAFVPHNLVGEGAGNSPVEISWNKEGKSPPRVNSPVLINLAELFPSFANRFQFAYDFVPSQETQKQQARVRYKHYRAAGYELNTIPADQINENNNG